MESGGADETAQRGGPIMVVGSPKHVGTLKRSQGSRPTLSRKQSSQLTNILQIHPSFLGAHPSSPRTPPTLLQKLSALPFKTHPIQPSLLTAHPFPPRGMAAVS